MDLFNSPLKLVKGGGFRSSLDGTIITSRTYYWASNVPGNSETNEFKEVGSLIFLGSAALTNSPRAEGHSIRCIKN